MTLRILDSFLREYLKTPAEPYEIAEKLSLSSCSVEKVEKYGNDYIYEIEVTTNRTDLYSVLGIAREAAAVLPTYGIKAEFVPLKLERENGNNAKMPLIIKNDPKLVNRICAVLMDVEISDSNPKIKERLETSGIRSLNNVIDVTNYVMRIIGHPSHVFDFDRLKTKVLTIREGKLGEKIKTLDGKHYALNGGEIIAARENGEIVDLLGIMGLENSVVTNNTKRILYFIDNNQPNPIRNASMKLGIRTEAAVLNEKIIDPEIAMDALLYGIELFKDYAKGKTISEIIDIYPNKPKSKTIEISFEKINRVIGINIDIKKSVKALTDLGFKVSLNKEKLKIVVPSQRAGDISIEEDVIEEIARIYGFSNLPDKLPKINNNFIYSYVDEYFWENKTKQALKYWGFTECYTYSFVSEEMYEGPLEEAVEVSNPLTEDFVYMRNSLIPSLLQVIAENKKTEVFKIFELANVYHKKVNDLPNEVLMLSGVLKNKNVNFYEVKGIIEQLLLNLGIKNVSFKPSGKNGIGASLYINKTYLGEIEVLDTNLIDFELNFEVILQYASFKKEYRPFAKYPPVIEDVSVIADNNVSTENIIKTIKLQSNLITDVSLTDSYLASRTFRIVYQDEEKNLTKEEVSKIRNKIISSLEKDFKAKIK